MGPSLLHTFMYLNSSIPHNTSERWVLPLSSSWRKLRHRGAHERAHSMCPGAVMTDDDKLGG